MRILLVSNYQPPHMGGIEFAAGSLKRCWEAQGHAVTWLTTDLPRRPDLQKPDNVRVPAWNGLEDRFQINSPMVYPWALGRISNLIASHDVVNIHSLAPGLSTLTLAMALLRRAPVVATQHVAVIPLKWAFLSRVQERFILGVARWGLRRGLLLTFVGQAVRDWFAARPGIPPDRLFMTPAGIDPHDYHWVPEDERAAARRRLGMDDARLQVLFVGRFYEKKGLPLIREVARRLPNASFTLVGRGPIAAEAWGEPNVKTIPYVSNEDLRALYGAHDVFIMPSYGEGWPAVVPQAMACGLPCAISEACFSGYDRDADRFWALPRTAEAFADKLSAIAENREPLRSERKAVSDYASAQWNWARTADLYVRLFEQARAERGR